MTTPEVNTAAVATKVLEELFGGPGFYVESNLTRIMRVINEGVTTLALCEVDKIIPRPGQLYRFVVMPDCEECERLGKGYDS